MEIAGGFKLTEIGIIPDEWEIRPLNSVADVRDGTHESPKFYEKGVPFVTSRNIINGKLDLKNVTYISENDALAFNKRSKVNRGDILMSMIGTIGNAVWVDFEPEFCIKNVSLIKPIDIDPGFLIKLMQSPLFQTYLSNNLAGGIQKFIALGKIRKLRIPYPPISEQRAIADALSDMDSLIASQEALIAKKRAIKQGVMQELLKPKEDWVEKTIDEVADCLDSLRLPLNESQLEKMRGNIPYCGANVVLDYINEYRINDSVILLAEDGGYFDEYRTRPIAYRMNGKIWVNNHAHVLKAKKDYDQNFLFYSLVNKNILNFITSGTRAKLNRSEMNKIPILLPKNKFDQHSISNLISNIDQELSLLKEKCEKINLIKQGMMQELLTGRIRLTGE